MPVDKRPPSIVDALKNDIHTLDSKITLIAQKMHTIEKNEEVIGRTIVAHNEKLREIEERGATATAEGAAAGVASADAEDFKRQMADFQKQLKALADDLREMRYVLDSINPLEFVTASKVRELVREEMADEATENPKKKQDGKDDLMERM